MAHQPRIVSVAISTTELSAETVTLCLAANLSVISFCPYEFAKFVISVEGDEALGGKLLEPANYIDPLRQVTISTCSPVYLPDMLLEGEGYIVVADIIRLQDFVDPRHCDGQVAFWLTLKSVVPDRILRH